MKRFVPLEELMPLPYSKQLHMISMLYIQTCIDDEKVKAKKFMSTLMPIRKFFEKQDRLSLYILYDYLYDLKEKTVMDLGTAFRNAEVYQSQKRFAEDQKRQPKVLPYESIDKCIKEMMEGAK